MTQYKTIAVKLPFSPSYRYAVGKSMTRFLDEFKHKKIIGIKCPSCKNVYVPPRNICGRCLKELSQFVDLPDVGVVENFIKAYVNITLSGEILALEAPKLYALVRFDGAKSSIYGEILASDVRIGDRVKVVWKDEPQGEWSDIVGFKIVS